MRALHAYRQRIWSCKYTGAAELTYEEAASSEAKIFRVVARFPPAIEEAAAKLVHHSVDPAPALAAAVAKLLPGTAPEAPAEQ